MENPIKYKGKTMWGEYFFIGSVIFALIALPLIERSRKPVIYEQPDLQDSSFSGDSIEFKSD